MFQNFYGGQNRERYTGSEYLLYGGGTLLLIALIVLYVFEFRYFSLYLNPKALVITALALGLSGGILWGYLWRNKADSSTESVQIYIFCILLSLVFAPLLLSLTNRGLDFRTPETKNVQIVLVQPQYSGRYGVLEGEKMIPNQLIVNYLHKNETFSFKTKNMSFVGLKRGTPIELTFRQGLFGFTYLQP